MSEDPTTACSTQNEQNEALVPSEPNEIESSPKAADDEIVDQASNEVIKKETVSQTEEHQTETDLNLDSGSCHPQRKESDDDKMEAKMDLDDGNGEDTSRDAKLSDSHVSSAEGTGNGNAGVVDDNSEKDLKEAGEGLNDDEFKEQEKSNELETSAAEIPRAADVEGLDANTAAFKMEEESQMEAPADPLVQTDQVEENVECEVKTKPDDDKNIEEPSKSNLDESPCLEMSQENELDTSPSATDLQGDDNQATNEETVETDVDPDKIIGEVEVDSKAALISQTIVETDDDVQDKADEGGVAAEVSADAAREDLRPETAVNSPIEETDDVQDKLDECSSASEVSDVALREDLIAVTVNSPIEETENVPSSTHFSTEVEKEDGAKDVDKSSDDHDGKREGMDEVVTESTTTVESSSADDEHVKFEQVENEGEGAEHSQVLPDEESQVDHGLALGEGEIKAEVVAETDVGASVNEKSDATGQMHEPTESPEQEVSSTVTGADLDTSAVSNAVDEMSKSEKALEVIEVSNIFSAAASVAADTISCRSQDSGVATLVSTEVSTPQHETEKALPDTEETFAAVSKQMNHDLTTEVMTVSMPSSESTPTLIADLCAKDLATDLPTEVKAVEVEPTSRITVASPTEGTNAFMTEVLEVEDVDAADNVEKPVSVDIESESVASRPHSRPQTRSLTAVPLQPEPILGYTHVACIAVVALVAIYFFFCL